MTVVAPLSAFGAIDTLVTPGDAAQTAQNIAESQSSFRWGITGLILVVILDIIVAVALLTLFRPVNRSVSIMAAAFRLVYATVSFGGDHPARPGARAARRSRCGDAGRRRATTRSGTSVWSSAASTCS